MFLLSVDSSPTVLAVRAKGGQLSAKALAAVDMAEAGLKGPAGSLSDATRQPPNTGAYTDDATSMGHGLVLPFEPITVTFRDVRYFVPLEVRLSMMSTQTLQSFTISNLHERRQASTLTG